MTNRILKASYLLMGIGITLLVSAAVDAFLISSGFYRLDYWLGMVGWTIGLLGSILYGYAFFKRLKQKSDL
ncbi:MAG: hypothetical protein AB1555_07200 [Nitrospirota bacterium]